MNQTFPSGPPATYSVPSASWSIPAVNSVTTPAGVMRAIARSLSNHRLPSALAVIELAFGASKGNVHCSSNRVTIDAGAAPGAPRATSIATKAPATADRDIGATLRKRQETR